MHRYIIICNYLQCLHGVYLAPSQIRCVVFGIFGVTVYPLQIKNSALRRYRDNNIYNKIYIITANADKGNNPHKTHTHKGVIL
jgi:hypothetical protein